MTRKDLLDLLGAVAGGRVAPNAALERLADWPFQDLGFAKIDHHRALRRGFPEVIFAEGKSTERLISLIEEQEKSGAPLLATRVSPEKATAILKRFPDAEHNEEAGTINRGALPEGGLGTVLILTAGTSDIPVAEEAAVTARVFGNPVEKVYDVGVAGLHRLSAAKESFKRATVVIVVAGMEGALASVVSGLLDIPVIGVPTSVGYGAGFGGIAALLSMLNSCSGGLTVVNIDNGFGAAVAASLINRGRTSSRDHE